MGAPATPGNAFGRRLEEAVYAAGYRSVRSLGHKAGVDPSLINRWISGATQPSAANLRKLAKPLHVEEGELFAAAFGGDASDAPPPVALEIARLLGPDTPLDEHERELLAELLNRVLAPYRNT